MSRSRKDKGFSRKRRSVLLLGTEYLFSKFAQSAYEFLLDTSAIVGWQIKKKKLTVIAVNI